MTVTLLPVQGCLVKHDDFGIGRVLESKIENDLARVEVRWPQKGTTQWHFVRDLSCGFQRGDTVQDSPHSSTRRTMGAGIVLETRTMAARHQVLVQFHDTGESRWIPYENLVRVADANTSYRAAQTTGDQDAERFRLKTLAYALDSWNQITGALDRMDVDPLPHQIDLVHRVLTSGQGNWLIADDVGLGKTIEVGLLLAAMKRRRQASRVLVVCPAGLTRQWRDEMKHKFHETYEIYGSDFNISEQSLWQIHRKVIVSIDRAKADDHKELFKRSGDWDIVIFDEAHHLSRIPNQATTQRYQLAAELRKQTDNFLFLTGTPHQGNHEQFVNLLLLLRPDLREQFGSMFTNQSVIADVILRNRKSQATDAQGNFIFRGQHTNLVEVQLSEAAQEFDAQLQNYVKLGYAAAEAGGITGRAIGFVMTTYRKLASSSIAAIEQSLRRRSDRLREPYAGVADWHLDAEQEDAFNNATDGQDNIADFTDIAASPFFQEEQRHIQQLLDLARRVRQDDRKLNEFLNQIADPLRKSGQKLLIFTEYRGTQEYLINALQDLYPDCGIAQINGGMSIEQKLQSINAFNGTAQFMVSTEAGGEGLNLHENCHILVNYDLPWNPSRLVQRAGRLYRYGQTERVIVFNIKLNDGFDNQVLNLMLERVSSIAQDMAAVGKEYREGLETEILGELLERIDIASIMSSNRTLNISHSESDVEAAVQRAKDSHFQQEHLFAHIEGYDPQRAAALEALGPDEALLFLKGVLPLRNVRVRNQLYGGKVLELELPSEMRNKFAEFGTRTVVRVTVDRQLARNVKSDPPVCPMDFASEFFNDLIYFAQSPRFKGEYAALSGPEPGILGLFRLRWQNDQGEPQGDELLPVFLPENTEAPTANPGFFADLLVNAQQSQTPSLTGNPSERKRRMERLHQKADRELAARCTEFRHPNDLVLLATADLTSVHS